LFPSSFCILIFVSLEVSYGRQRECKRKDLRRRDSNTNDRHPDVLDDSGPPKDENENGKKPVCSVMKAPGEWMKLRCAVQVGLQCHRLSDDNGWLTYETHRRNDAASIKT
jgi:hypothetical protein